MLEKNARMDNVMVDSTAVELQRNVKNAVKTAIVLIIRNASMNFSNLNIIVRNILGKRNVWTRMETLVPLAPVALVVL